MYNKSIFDKELNLITNEEYRNFISKCLDNVPEYFWIIPASSSGEHHPSADLGEGGLLRHTKACVQVGLDLLRCEQFVEDNNDNRDIVIGALLLHDCIKNGFEDSGHTDFFHPVNASTFIGQNHESLLDYNWYNYILTIRRCIESHMGKWNTNKECEYNLNTPSSPIEKLVHLADYIASRKYTVMDEIGLFI